MAFRYDPELEAILAPVAQAMAPDGSNRERGWKEVREESELGLAMLNDMSPPVLEVSSTDYELVRDDGARIGLRWYVPDESDRTSAVVYLHGGGMICGSVDLYEPVVAAYVGASGVRMLAVDYRVAPEYPHPAPVEDCFAALGWLHEHAAELGIDPGRIAVMGDSGGGGLAAGVALLARDRGTPLAHQILVYPMLDDRNTTPDPELVPFAAWTYDSNRIGWTALLGAATGGDDVPSYAAPARAGPRPCRARVRRGRRARHLPRRGHRLRTPTRRGRRVGGAPRPPGRAARIRPHRAAVRARAAGDGRSPPRVAGALNGAPHRTRRARRAPTTIGPPGSADLLSRVRGQGDTR